MYYNENMCKSGFSRCSCSTTIGSFSAYDQLGVNKCLFYFFFGKCSISLLFGVLFSILRHSNPMKIKRDRDVDGSKGSEEMRHREIYEF